MQSNKIILSKTEKFKTIKGILIVSIVIAGIIIGIYMAFKPSPLSEGSTKGVGMDGFYSESTPSVIVASSPDPFIRSLQGQWYCLDSHLYVNGFQPSADIYMIIDDSLIDLNKGILVIMKVFLSVITRGNTIVVDDLIAQNSDDIRSENITQGIIDFTIQSDFIPIEIDAELFTGEEFIFRIEYRITFTFYHIYGYWNEFVAESYIIQHFRFVNFDESQVDTVIGAMKYIGITALSLFGLAIVKKKKSGKIKVLV